MSTPQAVSKKWFNKARKMYKARAPKILLWGPPGSGKTYFLGTCPKPVYIFDTELGSVSVMYHNFNELLDEIFIAEVGVVDNDTQEINPAKTLDNFEEAMREILPEVEENGTLCIDSGTVVWQTLGWWLDDLKDKRQVKMTKSGQMMQTEWSRANRRFYNWIMKMVNKKKLTVVITAQSQDLYDGPNVSKVDGKMRINKQTPHWVDFVYHIEVVTKFQAGSTTKKRMAILEKCRYADAFSFSSEQRQVRDITYPKMVEQLTMLGLLFSEDGTVDRGEKGKPVKKKTVSEMKEQAETWRNKRK
ncbi:AAA family ATPase [Candidatus Pacearchaeota archaeon]|nr:AAA family ATPase [Candidatus Pacearchaeota archaeon]